MKTGEPILKLGCTAFDEQGKPVFHEEVYRNDTVSFNLSKQKYVLQYYLRVGDQNCSEPGIYKLYEPDEEILPSADAAQLRITSGLTNFLLELC